MHRQTRHAFTRADLIAAVVVVITLISVSHVLLGEDNKVSTRTRESLLKARGIHSGMVLYAQGNKDYYPGLQSNGDMATLDISARPDIFGTKSKIGHEPVYRMSMLLRGNFFAPEYVINPFEDKRKKTAPVPGKDITTDNFSFAMLRIDDKSKRVGEWRATNNSRAAIVSDRNLGKGAGKDARGISKPDGEGWSGAVAYGDNHAVYETNPLRKTEYALRGEVTGDDLFAENKTDEGEEGADAAMVYQDAKTYVDQK